MDFVFVVFPVLLDLLFCFTRPLLSSYLKEVDIDSKHNFAGSYLFRVSTFSCFCFRLAEREVADGDEVDSKEDFLFEDLFMLNWRLLISETFICILWPVLHLILVFTKFLIEVFLEIWHISIWKLEVPVFRTKWSTLMRVLRRLISGRERIADGRLHWRFWRTCSNFRLYYKHETLDERICIISKILI